MRKKVPHAAEKAEEKERRSSNERTHDGNAMCRACFSTEAGQAVQLVRKQQHERQCCDMQNSETGYSL